MPTISTGHSSVMTTNHFDFTRSRNSRFAMTYISRIGNLLGAALGNRSSGPDARDEDLVERRHHDLEAANCDAFVEQRREQLLRCDAPGEDHLAVRMIAG